jgi:hypothetical protein
MTEPPKSNIDGPLDFASPEAELEMVHLGIAAQANQHIHGHEYNLRLLTAQETSLIAGISMGMTKLAAAKRSGMGLTKASVLMNDPAIQHHLTMLHNDRMSITSEAVKYNMVDAHMDIEMGKKMSANAMEWFRGVEMQMKLHGLGQEKQVLDINVTSIQKVDQLAELDDAALLKLMGAASDSLMAKARDVTPTLIDDTLIDDQDDHA